MSIGVCGCRNESWREKANLRSVAPAKPKSPLMELTESLASIAETVKDRWKREEKNSIENLRFRFGKYISADCDVIAKGMKEVLSLELN